MMMPDAIEVGIAPEDAHEPDPWDAGNDPHTVPCDPVVAEGDDWDLIDLEWRANESAAMDAYERGLNFA